MAAITLTQRDLVATRRRLEAWFCTATDRPVAVSDLRPANRAAGWSSETLTFSVDDGGASTDHVIRIPPAGGGMFQEYDLDGQTRTQQLLREFGIPTPSPITYEADTSWIGSAFLVMPRIAGHTPSDTSYATKGWLHDAGAIVQRRAHDSFLQILADIQRVPTDRVPWLRRPTGTGNDAELQWWHEYVCWATDAKVPDLIERAFIWLRRHRPDEVEPIVCWGDARLSNALFGDNGQLVAALDWEQACLCPPETDLAWWLATRRQTLAVQRITADPELPGFDSRHHVIARFETIIGRKLKSLDWYEIFAAVRMGCCILRTQVLLRSLGQAEHGFMSASPLPKWVVEKIERGD